MALTHKFSVGTRSNASGTTAPGTSPNTAAGDVAVDDLILVGVGCSGTFGGGGSPTASPAVGAMTLVESFLGSGGNFWVGIFRCTSAIARNTVYSVSWTTARTARASTIASYSATETFALYYSLTRDAAETVQETAGGIANWPAAATDLTPAAASGSTGLGWRFMWGPVNNASITAGTIATDRRSGTTTGVQQFTHDIFRTVSTAYACQATGMSAFAFDRTGIALHIPTGAAPPAGDATQLYRTRSLMGVGA